MDNKDLFTAGGSEIATPGHEPVAEGSPQRSPLQPKAASNPMCYLDVSALGHPVGRIVIELYAHATPRTADNFRLLCTGEMGYGFRQCPFHRVVRNFICQSGAFVTPSGRKGGCSVYNNEGYFEDEDFRILHDKPGVVSMANAGPDMNGSQFFITLVRAPYLDGRHVAFGHVVSGMETVREIARFGTASGVPTTVALIEECGVLEHPSGEREG